MLSRAQTQTQEAFQRYTACLEAEARARRDVVVAEQHRDDLSKSPVECCAGRPPDMPISDCHPLAGAVIYRYMQFMRPFSAENLIALAFRICTAFVAKSRRDRGISTRGDWSSKPCIMFADSAGF